jgi:uncharacterized membrane protein YdjX (TVP38/TMEM64 family)
MRSPAVRFAVLVLLVGAGLAAAYHFGLIDWLRQGSVAERVTALRGPWWTPLALIGLCTLAGCLPLPTTAVVLIGGAVYGPWRGWALNLFGCVFGAFAGYGLARALGRDFAIRILGPKRWAKLDGLMQEHGFWAMVRARWMLPLAVVDYGAGIGGMKALPFLLSSIVGMAIPVAIYTYVGHLLLVAPGANPARTLAKAAALVLALLAVSLAGPAWRWLRRLRAARRSD